MDQNGESRNKCTCILATSLTIPFTAMLIICNGETTISFINIVGKPGILIQNNDCPLILTPNTKINSKWIKEVKLQSIKLLEKQKGKNFMTLVLARI
jgi:hypothetical protein